MATSTRNLIGGGDVGKSADIYEAAASGPSRAMRGTQPIGRGVGKELFIGYDKFVQGGLWDKTETGTGTAVITARSTTTPPVWTLTTGATQHDTIALDCATTNTLDSATITVWSPFAACAGFDISFKARFKITSTVADAAILIGLKKAGAAFSSSAIAVDDFIGFNMPITTAAMVGTVRTGDTGTATSTLQTVVVDTWYDLEMKVIGRSAVEFWVNGVLVAKQATMTNLPANTVNLALGCAVSTNASAAAVLVLQNLSCAQEAI